MFFTALKKNRRNSHKTNISGSPDHMMLALEPRLLFDASGLVAGLDLLPDPNQAPDSPGPEPGDLGPDLDIPFFADPVPLTVDTPTSLVFIDAGVIDYENLVADIPGKVVLLSAQSDGIGQIRDILSQYKGLEAVHIISHGTSGSITLGDAILSNDTLDTHALNLRQWGDSLAPGADILIYGCNVAKGIQGQSFVAQLSDITGADVAASDDITGAAAKGGDWELEIRTGIIESGQALSLTTRSGYTGILVDYTVNEAGDNRNVAVDGVYTKYGLLNLREAIFLSNANGEADTITFDPGLAGTTNTLKYGALTITDVNGVTVNGDIDGDGKFDITLDANKTDRVFEIDVTAAATLTGLSITGGFGSAEKSGGGIINRGGDLTITDSTISDNYAYFGGGIYNYGILKISNSTISDNDAAVFGGGIHNQKATANLTIDNCTISDNYAKYGGGGGIASIDHATLTITNSTISNNNAYYGGGGIYNVYYSPLTIIDSTISGNSVGDGGGGYGYGGGGIHNAYYSPLTITDSTISGNSADYGDGGGIFNYESSTIDITGTTISNNTAKYGGGISNIDSPLTITTSNISNNTAQYVGGGIANGDSNLTITDSTISYNSTDGDGGLGGGIYNTSIGAETATITRSTIHHNSSHSRGGGIYNQNGTFSVSNSTISYNSTTDPAGLGGGIHNIADFSLSHSTLSGNTAFKGSGLYNRSYDGSICKIYIDHTIVTDQVGGTTGITSQGYNLFAQASVTGADTNAGDLLGSNANLLPLASNGGPTLTHALGSGSAAWNAGNPGATAGAGGVPVTDQRGAGYSRVVNTIDIGAVEIIGSPGGGGSGGGGSGNQNNAPIANSDDVTTNEDTPVTTGNVLSNDMDPDGDTLTMTGVDTSVTKGSVTNNGDGTFYYDPQGQFEYLALGTTAVDSFVYTVSDGKGGTDTARVNITITGVNDVPTANGDNFTTNEDTPVTTGNVLDNDGGLDAGDIHIISEIDTSATKGSVTNNGDGTFYYDPQGQFEYLAVGTTAVDTFTYTVSDGKGGIDTATVTITVTGVNDAPLGRDDSGFTTRYDNILRVAANRVLANDTDPDIGDTCCITACDMVSKNGAQVTLNLDGGFDYDPTTLGNQTPGEGQTLGDTFSYTVSDGNGGTDTVTVAVSVTGPPPNPPLGNGKGNSQYLLTPNGSDDDWVAGSGQKDVFFTSSGRAMAGLFGKGHSNPLGQGGVSDPFFIPLPPPLEQDGTTEEAPDAPPDSGGGPNTGDSNNNSGAPNENTSAPPVSQGFNEQLQREANRFETQRIHFLGLLAEKKAWV